MSAETPEEFLDVDEILGRERDPDAPEEGPRRADRERFVVFEVADRRLAAEVEDVRSVVDLEEPTRIPRAPDAIAGIVDLRGEITAVVDPRTLFAVDAAAGAERLPRVMVFDRATDEQSVGLAIDGVTGVESIPSNRVDDDPGADDVAADAERRVVGAVIERETGEGTAERTPVVDVDGVLDVASPSRDAG